MEVTRQGRFSVTVLLSLSIAAMVLGAAVGWYLVFWTQRVPRTIDGGEADLVHLASVVRNIILRQGNTLDRRAAAQQLAQHPLGDSWTIILLADETVSSFDFGPSDATDAMQTAREPFDIAVVAALIESLRRPVAPAVLWALTARLDDARMGAYGGQYDPLEPRIEAKTEPIRELARQVLIDSLAVDHGYDRVEWRREILKQDSKASGAESSSASG